MPPKLSGCLVVSLLLLLFLSLVGPSHGSLFPSTPKPRTYSINSPVPLKVNKITSTRTNIPHSFYSLPFCTPQSTNPKDESIVEILRGDHIEDSLYEINALEKVDCKAINYSPNVNNSKGCTEYGPEALAKFAERVGQGYTVHWTLDGLPAAVPKYFNLPKNTDKQYTSGFPLGIKEDDANIWINNHVDITVIYGNADNDSIVILGFEVVPRSQWYDPASWEEGSEGDRIPTCPYNALIPNEQQSLHPPPPPDPAPAVEGETSSSERRDSQVIFWTYSVHWELSDIPWQKRWDVYMRDTGGQIHIVSILNSLIIVLFLTVVVATIFKRTLNCSDTIPRDEDETRWRTIGNDVFRAPAYPLPLSICIGTGVHLIGISAILMGFGIFGLLSPAKHGAYINLMIGLFVIMGLLSGCYSSYCYKVFRGVHRVKNAVVTALFFPLLFFTLFFVINLMQREAGSSAAIPITAFLEMIALWFGFSIPLGFVGSAVGTYLAKPVERPHTSHNSHARTPLHRMQWYQRPLFSILFAGVLPFGVIVIEYFYIVYSMFGVPIYDSYRYLGVSLVTLFATCAGTNVVVCFFQLNSGDFHWWWRPFLHGLASSFYMFVYTTVIFFSNFHLRQTESTLFYFIFAFISSSVFFLLTGTIGFAACYLFLQMIYKNHTPVYTSLVPLHKTHHNQLL